MELLKDILRTKKIEEYDTLEESNAHVAKYISNDIEELDDVMATLKEVMLSDLAKENPELRNEMYDVLSKLGSVRGGLETIRTIIK